MTGRKPTWRTDIASLPEHFYWVEISQYGDNRPYVYVLWQDRPGGEEVPVCTGGPYLTWGAAQRVGHYVARLLQQRGLLNRIVTVQYTS